jgi:hypothetical protein
MPIYGRPPDGDPLLTRVQEGLQRWKRLHYGDGETPRNPDQAQLAAKSLADLTHEELKARHLQDDRRSWLMNVERGARVLADTELFGSRYPGSDAVDNLYGLGFGILDYLPEQSEFPVRGSSLWSLFGFCVGAAIAALITTLWVCA